MTSTDACTIPNTASVKDALLALERGSSQVVIVLDEQQRVAGILTDGDLRRAFLSGATVTAPVLPYVNTEFVSVQQAVGRVEVLELMKARRISVVPILDSDRRFSGIHLLHDVVRVQRRPNWAVVMAGGRGSRLGPLTDTIPKPMIRVANRPILERLVLHLAGFGFQRIFLSINYMGHVVEEHFGDGKQFGCSIEYLREERFLGTGGALSLLPNAPEHPLIVVNGDLVTSADVDAMLAFHERGRQSITVGLHSYVHTIPFGCVDTEGDQVSRIEEKPTIRRLVNAGMYVINPSLISRIPRDQEFHMPMLIVDALNRGEHVSGFPLQGDWIDVGHREQLQRAQGNST